MLTFDEPKWNKLSNLITFYSPWATLLIKRKIGFKFNFNDSELQTNLDIDE